MLFFKILVFTSINLLYKYKLMWIINKKIKILKRLKLYIYELMNTKNKIKKELTRKKIKKKRLT